VKGKGLGSRKRGRNVARWGDPVKKGREKSRLGSRGDRPDEGRGRRRSDEKKKIKERPVKLEERDEARLCVAVMGVLALQSHLSRN